MSKLIRAVVISLDGDVLDLVSDLADIEVLGFLDAQASAGDSGFSNLGNDETWLTLKEQEPELRAILAADPPKLRKRLATFYGLSALLTVIAPGARVSPTANVGQGTLIQASVLVSRNVRLGHGCKINYGAALHHDVAVGNFSTVAPYALVLGTASIGEECYVGAGAVVMPRRKVGDGAMIGAGAIVTRDVPPGATTIGVPARIVSSA